MIIKKIVKIIQKNMLDAKGRFHVRRARIIADEEFKTYMTDHFPNLKWSDAYHLLLQGIDHELRCRNENCNNPVIRNRSKNGNIDNFGFQYCCSKVCSNTDTMRIEKAKNTNIQKFGGIGFGNPTHTANATKTMMKKYGKKFYVETDEFIKKKKQTMLKKWGTEISMGSNELKQLYRDAMIKKHGVHSNLKRGSKLREKVNKAIESAYGNKQIMATTYIRKLKEAQGKWIPLEDKSDFDVYKLEVWRFTRKSLLTSGKVLDNFEHRGRADNNPNGMHLDHKFSIFSGFITRIPPHIIGGFENLEMIPHTKNCSKGSDNSIALEDLM